jgi:hypothetical protein
MDYLNSLKNHKNALIVLVLFVVIFLVVFKFIFGFHPNNDTEGYIYSIQFFRGEFPDIYPNRYLNPFYPLIAAKVLFFLPPASSLIVLNMVFYCGIAFLSYDLFRRVFRNTVIGLISSILIVSSYPMVRYALTQVQDMGGYFWFIATIYASWRWYEDRHWQWITIAGICTAFGLLTKESGAMGALFFGVLVLLEITSLKNKLWSFTQFSIWPFVTLLINRMRGYDVGYNSYQWLVDNWRIYAEQNYTLFKWLGVNISTYNVILPFFLIGLYLIFKARNTPDKNINLFLFASIPAGISYFAWPLFIGRTVFISAWLVIPIAVYGGFTLVNSGGTKRLIVIAGLVLALLFPTTLQYTLRYAHVFKIYDDCNKKIVCSWNYFWANRENISTER